MTFILSFLFFYRKIVLLFGIGALIVFSRAAIDCEKIRARIRFSIFLILCSFPLFFHGRIEANCSSNYLNLWIEEGHRALESSKFIFLDDSISYSNLLESIKKRFKDNKLSNKKIRDRQIEILRLTDEKDLNIAAKEGKMPIQYYGEKTTADWFKAKDYVDRNADGRPLSVELLQEIHRQACAQLPFHGFEGRRIVHRYKNGEISEQEMRQLLEKAYKQNAEVSAVPHASLVGKWRSEGLDQIEHRGSSVTFDGQRFFEKIELDAIRLNPYLQVDESSLVEFSPGKFKGRIYYQDVNKIDQSVKAILSQTEKRLALAKNDGEYILAVYQMQKDLISVHPFLDGNGRTIRLLSDLLYQRRGLPPPLLPPLNEFTDPPIEAFIRIYQGMMDYVNLQY